MRRIHPRPGPTGAELRAARKAGGMSQAALGVRAGISRHAVSYWECRAQIDPKSWAVQRMAEAAPRIHALLQDWFTNTRGRGMGVTAKSNLPIYARSTARARNGSYSPSPLDLLLEEAITRELSRMQEREAQRLARLRVVCGAKTTRKGTPCRNKSEPGRKRCKFHGGKSTGPKTAEGRERIAEAQRQRWAKWRGKHPSIGLRCQRISLPQDHTGPSTTAKRRATPDGNRLVSVGRRIFAIPHPIALDQVDDSSGCCEGD